MYGSQPATPVYSFDTTGVLSASMSSEAIASSALTCSQLFTHSITSGPEQKTLSDLGYNPRVSAQLLVDKGLVNFLVDRMGSTLPQDWNPKIELKTFSAEFPNCVPLDFQCVPVEV